MDLEQLTILINIIVRIKAFYINLRSNPKLQRNLVITNAVYIFICLCSKASFTENDLRWFYLKNLFRWIMLTAFIVFLFGKGLTNCIYTYRFGQIGLKNKSGQFPQLLYKKRKNDSLSLGFYSPGLSHDIWEDNILKIENALDITISNITTGKKDSEIIINAYDGKYDWTENTFWKPSYMSAINKLDSLILGESVYGLLTINLHLYAHILIGGMTGSGKTILLKQLLLQCIAKKYDVYIADFKMGVDYPDYWKTNCTFLTSRDSVIDKLKVLTEEMESRQKLLSNKGCNNIRTYNDTFDEKLKRIIFACDELAELLDSTGMDKTEKAQIKEIEGYVSKIARLGRASGIHLILATQRPDADILNGQIKSNMTYRLCGRANEVLSRIILDSTDASKLIPPESKGVFINQEGMRIKGFYIKDGDLEKTIQATTNNHLKGR